MRAGGDVETFTRSGGGGEDAEWKRLHRGSRLRGLRRDIRQWSARGLRVVLDGMEGRRQGCPRWKVSSSRACSFVLQEPDLCVCIAKTNLSGRSGSGGAGPGLVYSARCPMAAR